MFHSDENKGIFFHVIPVNKHLLRSYWVLPYTLFATNSTCPKAYWGHWPLPPSEANFTDNKLKVLMMGLIHGLWCFF